MFRKKIKISSTQAVLIHQACYVLSTLKGVKPLVTFRMTKNVKELEEFIKELEEQKLIIVKEYSELNEDGSPKIDGNEYIFKTPKDKADAIVELEKLFTEEHEFALWHFEASGVANENAEISGDLWSSIAAIIIDDESIRE